MVSFLRKTIDRYQVMASFLHKTINKYSLMASRIYETISEYKVVAVEKKTLMNDVRDHFQHVVSFSISGQVEDLYTGSLPAFFCSI